MFLPTLQLSSGFVETGRCSCRQVLCSSGVVVFCAQGQTHVVSIADSGSTYGFPAPGLAMRCSPCQPRPEPRGVVPGGGACRPAGKAAETCVHAPAALVSLVAYVLCGVGCTYPPTRLRTPVQCVGHSPHVHVGQVWC